MERNQTEPQVEELDNIVIRTLSMDDLDGVVRIDEASTQRNRKDFFRRRIRRTMEESSIHMSLAAELDGMMVGFLTVSLNLGEFGMTDTVAVLDAIGVHPDYRGRHVAAALLRQLEMQLRALHVETLRTEVEWDQWDLLAFLRNARFRPVPRLCLEKKIFG